MGDGRLATCFFSSVLMTPSVHKSIFMYITLVEVDSAGITTCLNMTFNVGGFFFVVFATLGRRTHRSAPKWPRGNTNDMGT